MKSNRMSLSEVWNHYTTELEKIKKQKQNDKVLLWLFSISTALMCFFTTLNIGNNKIMRILAIASLVIAFLGLIGVILSYLNEKKLKNWFHQTYACPKCDKFIGEEELMNSGCSCKNCSTSITPSLSIQKEKIKINHWLIPLLLTCAVIGTLVFIVKPVPIPVKMLEEDMVHIDGGTFEMGATENQKEVAFKDEYDPHKVSVADFYLCKHEVTQDLWEVVMGYNNSKHPGDSMPIENVTYNECLEFIKKLNKMTGKKYRLPTEEEWEYAARGGKYSTDLRYAGSNNVDEVAWYAMNSGQSTHKVCLKVPNELGLYDMSGNVLEWCTTIYSKEGYTVSDSSKQKDDDIVRIVMRGGSVLSDSDRVRVSYRQYFELGMKGSGVGLRLVRE